MTLFVEGRGGKDGQSVKTDNILSFDTRASLVYAYSDGPVVPLGTRPDGQIFSAATALHFDKVPLENADGTQNFEGVHFDTREGSPNQASLNIPAIDRLETGDPVTADLGVNTPYVRIVDDPEAQAVEIKVTFPDGLQQNQINGDQNSAAVELAFDLASVGGDLIEQVVHSVAGKTEAESFQVFRISLPPGEDPWQVRVRRLTPDSDGKTTRNRTQITQVDVVKYAALTYPDTALVGVSFSTAEFGGTSQMGIEAYGRLIRTPTGYDPIRRTYPPLWDGTFSYTWSDNPAWVAFDLLTNARVGLGLSLSQIDLAGFYDIAMYCDAWLPDGYGGQEPRFSFNGQITSAKAPIELLNQIAAIWRGSIYWAGQVVTATCDKPTDASIIINPSNVIDGQFVWSTKAKQQQASVFKVRWIDPARGYEEAVETHVEPDLLRELGYRERVIELPWCTSQGQAARMARSLAYTQRYENELVTYRASLDHLVASQGAVFPGQVVALRDPARAGSRGTHGRLQAVSPTHVTLDRDISLEVDQAYSLHVSDRSGQPQVVPIRPMAANQVAGDFAFDLSPGAPWLLTSSQLQPEWVRILSVEWVDKTIATVTGVKHNPAKFAALEDGLVLEAPRTTLIPSGAIAPVTQVRISGLLYAAPSGPTAEVTISWKPPQDRRVSAYDLWVQLPGEEIEQFYPNLETTQLQIHNKRDGLYQVRIRAKSPLGARSSSYSYARRLEIFAAPPSQVKGFDADLGQEHVQLTWEVNPEVDLERYEIRFSPLVQEAVWEAASPFAILSKDVSAKSAPLRSGTYLIKAMDTSGGYSLNASHVSLPEAAFETYNVIQRFAEGPAWAGAHDGTIAAAVHISGDDGRAKLQLAGVGTVAHWPPLAVLPTVAGLFPAEGLYYLNLGGSGYFDLGGVYKTFVSAAADLNDLAPAYPMDSWGSMAGMGTLTGDQRSGLTTVAFEVRTTFEDPGSAQAVWSQWQALRPSAYEARGFAIRARLTTVSPSTTPYISQINVGFDMEDRVVSLRDHKVPPGGTYVAIDPPFYGDAIHITQGPQNLPEGATLAVVNKTRQGFQIAVLGSDQPATVDLTVRGYGKQQ